MESPFEEFEAQEYFSTREIATKIWSEPRKILSFIHNKGYEENFYLIIALSGIANALGNIEEEKLARYDLPFWVVILITVVAGALLGWIGSYIYAALVSFTGSWFGGRSNTHPIFRILNYAQIPNIAFLFILFPFLLYFQKDLYFTDFSWDSTHEIARTISVILVAITEIILAFWSIYLSIVGVAVVQKISMWKAFFNLVAALAVVIIPILLIVLLAVGCR